MLLTSEGGRWPLYTGTCRRIIHIIGVGSGQYETVNTAHSGLDKSINYTNIESA